MFGDVRRVTARRLRGADIRDLSFFITLSSWKIVRFFFFCCSILRTLDARREHCKAHRALHAKYMRIYFCSCARDSCTVAAPVRLPVRYSISSVVTIPRGERTWSNCSRGHFFPRQSPPSSFGESKNRLIQWNVRNVSEHNINSTSSALKEIKGFVANNGQRM